MLRLAFALLLLPAVALAAPWRLDPASSIAVKVGWEGRMVEVRFPDFSGQVEFDEANPERAQATISVSAQSATTGAGVVDALVRSDDYLGAGRFPTIVFEVDRLTRTSSQTADISGKITLRGVTRPLSFTAQVIRYGPADDDRARFEAGFDLTGSIDRTQFGSTGGLPEVAAVLPIHIRLLMHSE